MPNISVPLSHIFNLSLITEIVSDKHKIAIVKSICTSGDNKLYSNYRPIAVLPCFSKILERLVYNWKTRHFV